MIDARYIGTVRRQLAEVEAEISQPGAAANPSAYRLRIAEHARLRGICEKADRLEALQREAAQTRELAAEDGTDAELRAMAEADLARIETALPQAGKDLLVALLPPDPSENRNIIMEIRAGTGGEEAALFAADLFRMYSRHADRRGWRIGVIDVNASDIGGYKEIVFSIEGQQVYRDLRFESGVHRVQRVPATEQQGRIHTSAATVAVLPEAEDVDEIEVRPEDIRLDLYRASGAGGQKVNKTESAVRITHLPTGLVVQCQDERSQTRNKDKAMRVLKARLLDAHRASEASKTADARRIQVGSGDRSERIRTYNYPQNRLTDHRINLTLYKLGFILEGDLDEVIAALQAHDLQERLDRHLPDAATP